MILLISLPAAAGLMLLDFDIIRLLFERGSFTAQSTLITAQALTPMAPGLIFLAISMLLIRVYYAIHDVRTPLITGLISIGVNIIFSFILVGSMDHGGLSLANTIAAAVNALMLFYFLDKRLNLLAGNYLKSGLVQTVFATLAMCVPAYVGKALWPHMSSKSGLALEILVIISAAVAVYFLVLKLMHSETLKDISKGLAKNNHHNNI